MTSGVELRRASSDDLPAVVELLRRVLGWQGGDEDLSFYRWKHFDNPFGESPAWVAVDGARIVGLRAFLRWRFVASDDSPILAVRAVDTATDPEYQGRGIFRRLTLAALDELQGDGVDLVFNTPNRRSLPGYLGMGWSVVGRLPVAVMLTHMRSLRALVAARGRAASRGSIETDLGVAAEEALADRHELDRLLAPLRPAAGIATALSPEFLRWRYTYAPLGYRVVRLGSSAADGLGVVRLRRRGGAVEAVVCHVLTPHSGRRAARLVADAVKGSGADYVLRMQRTPVSVGPFVRLRGTGPILTVRLLRPVSASHLRDWGVQLGDIELF